MITIQLNGGNRTIASGTRLPDLLSICGLSSGGVLVEHNGRALFQREFGQVELQDGDRVEFIRIAAGG